MFVEHAPEDVGDRGVRRGTECSLSSMLLYLRAFEVAEETPGGRGWKVLNA